MTATNLFFLFVISANHVFARTWNEVIDKSVYMPLLIDPFREKFAQEYDPLNLTKAIGVDTAPTTNALDTTNDQNETRNECGTDEILHIVRMFDSWGDGWDHTVMEIVDDSEHKYGTNVTSSGKRTQEDNDQQNDDGQTDDGQTDDGQTVDGQTDDGRTDDRETDDRRTDDGNNEAQQSEETDDAMSDDQQNQSGTDDGSSDDQQDDEVRTDDGGDNNSGDLKNSLLSYLGNRKLTEVATSKIENLAQTSYATSSESNSSASLLSGSKLVFKGSLKDGSAGNGTVCLMVGKCYTISVAGGLWPAEVKWDIRQTITNSSNSVLQQLFLSIAKGVGAAKCKFSVSDPTTGEQACPFTCEGVKEMEESLSDILNGNDNATNAQNSNNFNIPSINSRDNVTNTEKVDPNQNAGAYSNQSEVVSITTNATSWNTSKTNISSVVDSGFSVSLIDKNASRSENYGSNSESKEAQSEQSKEKEGTFVAAFQFPVPVRSPTRGANAGNLRTLSPGVDETFTEKGDPGEDTFSPSPSVAFSMIPSITLFPTTSSYPTTTAFPTLTTDGNVANR